MAAPKRPNRRPGSPAAKLERARRFALALPEALEAPHFEYNSFRVKGKIFATVPTEGDRLHIFVGEGDVEEFVASAPDIIERVYWGAKVAGVRVWMANADDAQEKRPSTGGQEASRQYVGPLRLKRDTCETPYARCPFGLTTPTEIILDHWNPSKVT